MKITLNNIGKIKEADVEIKGITVIAGENISGKSTVGRALFSVFNSMYDMENKILESRVKSIRYALEDFIFLVLQGESERTAYRKKINMELASSVVNEYSGCDNNKQIREKISKYIIDTLNSVVDTDMKREFINIPENTIDNIIARLNISNEKILNQFLENSLEMEFNGQINSINNDEYGEIVLNARSKSINVKVDNNEIVEVKNAFQVKTEVIYIDDPLVADRINYEEWSMGRFSYSQEGHRIHLLHKLNMRTSKKNELDEIIIKKHFNEVFDKLDKDFEKRGTKNGVKVVNLSTGLKTFVIMEELIKKGIIENNGTIILDEPEVNLHPDWQLLLAQLIVLLQKEFNLHILLNTHSPYFLRAIEVYAKKYQIEDVCKYYASEIEADYAIISDVTDDTELIYKKLSKAFQTLEDEVWADED